MQLDLVNFRGLPPTASTPSPLLVQQRVGAVLEAIAVRDARNGQLWLDFGGHRHPARVASGESDGPQDGEKLLVRVLRNSPVLALETVEARRPAVQSAEAAVISDALRRAAPRQESQGPLLANVAYLQRNAEAAQSLPARVMAALTRLWEALPSTQSLAQPAAFERALQRSGAFLEQQLAAGDPQPDDLKTLLLQLRTVLRDAGAQPQAAAHAHHAGAPIPLARGALSAVPAAPASLALVDAVEVQLNELARQTDGVLARMTTSQLASAPTDPLQPQPLLIELPVRIEDRASVLRLRIEQEEGQRREAAGDSWSVEAALDLGVAGGLHARVSLTGRRIGVQFRAESPAIVHALAARTPELEAILREAGLETERIVCLHGLPKADHGAPTMRLLDVRA